MTRRLLEGSVEAGRPENIGRFGSRTGPETLEGKIR